MRSSGPCGHGFQRRDRFGDRGVVLGTWSLVLRPWLVLTMVELPLFAAGTSRARAGLQGVAVGGVVGGPRSAFGAGLPGGHGRLAVWGHDVQRGPGRGPGGSVWRWPWAFDLLRPGASLALWGGRCPCCRRWVVVVAGPARPGRATDVLTAGGPKTDNVQNDADHGWTMVRGCCRGWFWD